jgi:hypothetical protein
VLADKGREVNILDEIIVPIGLILVGALVTFLVTYYWRVKTAAEKALAEIISGRQALKDRVTDLEFQLRSLKEAVVPISTLMQAALVKELTHLSTPEMDALLVKIGPPYALTHDEEQRLVVLLEERAGLVGSMLTESERNAAKMLPWIIQRVKAEAAMGVTELQQAALGATPTPVEEVK